MQSSQGIFCEHIHIREGAHLLRLFMESVCTIRKQKQKKITFTIKRPNVFETQCLKVLKSNIEQRQWQQVFQWGSVLLRGWNLCGMEKEIRENRTQEKGQNRRIRTKIWRKEDLIIATMLFKSVWYLPNFLGLTYLTFYRHSAL